jgi:hypothetical protein
MYWSIILHAKPREVSFSMLTYKKILKAMCKPHSTTMDKNIDYKIIYVFITLF